MASSQDTEITLGTAKLLGLFFGLVIICAVFFAFGYTLGRKSDSALVTATPQTISNGVKPGGSNVSQASGATGYKPAEQKDGNSQLTPSSANPPAGDQGTAAPTNAQAASQNPNIPDPMAPIPVGNYFVQVAAVTKQDDAEALVDALKKKEYPAFVAANSSTDKLFRVQLGPFGDVKEAEAMRSRLINDGYNPILKK